MNSSNKKWAIEKYFTFDHRALALFFACRQLCVVRCWNARLFLLQPCVHCGLAVTDNSAPSGVNRLYNGIGFELTRQWKNVPLLKKKIVKRIALCIYFVFAWLNSLTLHYAYLYLELANTRGQLHASCPVFQSLSFPVSDPRVSPSLISVTQIRTQIERTNERTNESSSTCDETHWVWLMRTSLWHVVTNDWLK